MSRDFAALPDAELTAVLATFAGEARDARRHTAGRASVMAAAAQARSASSVRVPRWRRRLAVGALAFTGANLALGGVVALAAGAQPDSLLYGVKRAAEVAKLSLTFDPVDKARLELEIADRRADEAVAMLSSGRPDLALQAAGDATELVREAGASLREHPSADNAQALQHASAQALGRLRAVFAALEAGADPGASAAARSLDHAWQQGLGGPGNEGAAPGEAHSAGGNGAGSQGNGGGGSGHDGGSPQPNPHSTQNHGHH